MCEQEFRERDGEARRRMIASSSCQGSRGTQAGTLAGSGLPPST